MFNIGPLELMVILIVALVVVGPKRLPEVGKTIGKSLREFRKATDEVRQSFDFNFNDDFEPDPPASGRHVETLDDDDFPARHVETLPESDELPGERFDGFEEPELLEEHRGAPEVLDGFEEPELLEEHRGAPEVLDGDQAAVEQQKPEGNGAATVEIPSPDATEEPLDEPSASSNGERPAAAPPAGDPE